ncbi:hypothetical protein WA158_007709 [Blastocystis sp. Blastoise]
MSGAEPSDNNGIIELAPEVDQALKDILHTDDVLDSTQFDPIAYINEQFPDEMSLSKLQPYSMSLKEKIVKLDQQILETVRDQSSASRDAEQDLKDAKETITELFKKIVEIKEKAGNSEELVQIICKDISKLDIAKKNLTESLNSLAKLQMYMSSLDAIEPLANTKKYYSASTYMGVIMQLYSYFEKYNNIEMIKQTQQRVNTIRDTYCTNIFNDFSIIDDLAYTWGRMGDQEEPEDDEDEEIITKSSLKAACKIIDSLGIDTRNRLIKSICKKMMDSYDSLFGYETKGGSLDQIDRRYTWFWNLMSDYEEKYQKIYPTYWYLQENLCIYFCEHTKESLVDLLYKTIYNENGSNNNKDYSGAVVSGMRKTLQFERELVTKYDLGPNNIADIGYTCEYTEEGAVVDGNSKSAVVMKYERLKKQEEKEHLKEEEKKKAIQEGRVYQDVLSTLPAILGSISSCFEPYLNMYITNEKTMLEKLIQKSTKDDDIEGNGQVPILTSVIQLFQYFKDAIARCTTLSTGQIMFSLYNEFKTGIKKYAEAINQKIVRTKGKDSFGQEVYKIKKQKDRDYICYVINTCVYMIDNMTMLENLIKKYINKDIAASIVIQKELSESYYDTISQSIYILMSIEYSKIEGYLYSMTSLNLYTIQEVGDTSPYVKQIESVLIEEIPSIKNIISPIYFRNLCDKLSFNFLNKFVDCIYKCKKINDIGAQQLYMDMHALKNLFLNLPVVGSPDSYTPTSASKRLISKSLNKADQVLKLISTPTEYIPMSFKEIMTDGTEDELLSILNLKGCTKKQRMELLEQIDFPAEINDDQN